MSNYHRMSFHIIRHSSDVFESIQNCKHFHFCDLSYLSWNICPFFVLSCAWSLTQLINSLINRRRRQEEAFETKIKKNYGRRVKMTNTSSATAEVNDGRIRGAIVMYQKSNRDVFSFLQKSQIFKTKYVF